MRYDYYTIDVSRDCGASIFDLGFAAIRMAEQRTRLHCIPSHWSAQPIRGTRGNKSVRFQVRRKRKA